MTSMYLYPRCVGCELPIWEVTLYFRSEPPKTLYHRKCSPVDPVDVFPNNSDEHKVIVVEEDDKSLPFKFDNDFKLEFVTPDYCGKELMRYGTDGSHLMFTCEVQGEHDIHRFTMSHVINGNTIRVIVEMEEEANSNE